MNQKEGLFPPRPLKTGWYTMVKRAKKRFKKFVRGYKDDPAILDHAKASPQSFLGYMKHCNGYRTTMTVLERLVFKRRD
jgi:hypothetical protein